MPSLQTLRARLPGVSGGALVATLCACSPHRPARSGGPGCAGGSACRNPSSSRPTSSTPWSRRSPLSGSAARPVPGGGDVPDRHRRGAAMAGQELHPEGGGAHQGGRAAALGPERPGAGVAARRAEAALREHPVDAGSRRRVPGSAERRHGRRPANARESQGRGKLDPPSSRRSKRRSWNRRPSSRSSPRARRSSTFRPTARP